MSSYPPPQDWQEPRWQQHGSAPHHSSQDDPQPQKPRKRIWPWLLAGSALLVVVVAAATLVVALWPRGSSHARTTAIRPSAAEKEPLNNMSAATAAAVLTGAAKFPPEYQVRLSSFDTIGIGSQEQGIPEKCVFPIRPGAFSVLQQLVGQKPDDPSGADMMVMMLFTWTGQDQSDAFRAWPVACPKFSPPEAPADWYTLSLTNTFSSTPAPGDYPDSSGVKGEIDKFKTQNTPGAPAQRVSSLTRYNYLVTVRGMVLLTSCSGENHHDLCDQIFKNTVSALRDLP